MVLACILVCCEAGKFGEVVNAVKKLEGVLGWVSNTSLFYEGVNPSFKFVVGFIAVVLAASLMEKEK